jgi:glycyl-tRNA synthetase beta subunit
MRLCRWWNDHQTLNAISNQIVDLKEIFVSTFEEFKASVEDLVVAAAETDVRLDAIKAKIADLAAQVAAGGVVNQAQLDDVAALVETAKASLAAVAVDITEAENL